jgi:hypothetical protein
VHLEEMLIPVQIFRRRKLMVFGHLQRSIVVACEEFVLLKEVIEGYSLCEIHRVVLGSIQASVGVGAAKPVDLIGQKGLKRGFEAMSLFERLW